MVARRVVHRSSCLRAQRLFAVVIGVVSAVVLWSVPPAAAVECGAHTAAFSEAFDGLPYYFAPTPICATDVGPGLRAMNLDQHFGTVTAAEVTQTNVWVSPTQHGQLLLGVLVGTLASGGGADFVASYVQSLGPDAAHGTVALDGRTVDYLDVPGGPRGYAYGEGSTVAIGFVRSPLGAESHDIAASSARQVYTRVLAKAFGVTLPELPQPDDGLDQWPLARGSFTTPTDAGWMYFRTPTEKAGVTAYHCGIAPGGVIAGCDYVPGDAPAGTNQTIVDAAGARYIHSDEATFTRDVDALPAGERLESGSAACGTTYQGGVTCRLGAHKFVVSGYGYLE